jgi:hypothetical protein
MDSAVKISDYRPGVIGNGSFSGSFEATFNLSLIVITDAAVRAALRRFNVVTPMPKRLLALRFMKYNDPL